MATRTSLTGVVIGLALTRPLLAGSLSLQRTYEGEAAADQFGFALAAAGDVDHDGFGDMIVGANVNDMLVTSGGKVYLYLGGTTLPATPSLVFAGEVDRGYAGGAVAGQGDLDGDGYGDWVVGAPGIGVDGTLPGQVYVFLGAAEPDASPDLVIQGEAPAGQFGAAVCLAPDLDGDGYSELVVGAPKAGGGRVYIYRGGPAPLDGEPDRILHAREVDQRFGRALACLPDHDGDGRDDLLVGIPRSGEQAVWAGAVLLYRGTADLDTMPDLTLLGQAAGDEFGSSLAVVADPAGGDDVDLLVGAPLANVAGAVDAGKAYLFHAGAILDSTPDLTLDGELAGDLLGQAVAAGFDWNDDGALDLAVGASGVDRDTLTDAGACYVFLAGDLLDALADTVISGSLAAERLGRVVTGGGDLRHDGRGTLLVAGNNVGDTGQVQLFASTDPTTAVPPAAPAPLARLAPAWPNPFNPRVQTIFELYQPGSWEMAIFDLRGRHVRWLQRGWFPVGAHRFAWDGCDAAGAPLPSGRYFLRACGHGQTHVVPLTLVR